MNKVMHFEIVVIEPQRAMDFYTKVFDWKFEKWEEGEMDYWMVLTVPPNTPGAINGGLRREMGTDVKEKTISVNAFVCTVVVDDIDDILNKVESAGGKILAPKAKMEKVGWLATCYDTEGNVFGVMKAEM